MRENERNDENGYSKASGNLHWLWYPTIASDTDLLCSFGVEMPAISKHLKNIFETGELQEAAVISKMETTGSPCLM